MTDPAGRPALLDAIRHLHGCEATWVESVPTGGASKVAFHWRGDVLHGCG